MATIGQYIVNDEDHTYTVTKYIWPDGGDHGAISSRATTEIFRLFQMIVAPLIILTCFRTLPGEVRIWCRIYRRKDIRIAEILFFVLKYTALTSACLDTLIQFGGTTWMGANGQRCRPIWWCVKLGYYSCITMVSCVVAFRCWIIFRCSRRAAAALLLGLMVHFAASMTIAATDINMNGMYLGTCQPDNADYDNTKEVFWYLATCIAFDVSVTAAGSWQLIRSSVGPFKMHKTTALLFWHNVHYVAILSCINITQCILYAQPTRVPSLTALTAALTIDLGLQQLIIEADTVNGVIACRVDEYEPKSFLSERRRALRKGESFATKTDVEATHRSESTRAASGEIDDASKAASSTGWGSTVPLVDLTRRDDASARLDVPQHDGGERGSQTP